MVWKTGLAMIALGLTLTLGGFFFLGTAISKVADEREVANLPIDAGTNQASRTVQVDPSTSVRLRLKAQLEITQEVLDTATERAQIVPFSLPINYRIADGSGKTVHLGAGTFQGNEIIPEKDGPHSASFDRIATTMHESERFVGPSSGEIVLYIEVPTEDEHGAAVTNVTAHVFDHADAPGGWVAGGAASIFLGPLLCGLGFLTWLIGLIFRRRPAQPAQA